MKNRLFAVLVIALLSLSLLTACVTGNAQTLDPPAVPQEDANIQRFLTAEEAEAIAFSHAQIKAGTIAYLHTELEYDDGILGYDIAFVSGSREYDYEIHAETGAVLRSEAEPFNAAPAATEPPATEAPKETRLTEEQVLDIALKHAGLSKDQVSRLKVEFGYDDGVPEYDVDYYHDGWEYDYEIHAETGVIRRSESEWETVKQSKSAATEPPATEAPKATRLTEEQVLDIALKHAGLSKDQVSRLKVEFDYDDGVPEYDVDFYHDGWEYEYEIHAESGKIRAWDKDRDD